MKKNICILWFLSLVLSAYGTVPPYQIKIGKQKSGSSKTYFKMGTAINPAGNTIQVNAQGLLFDGVPAIPVMGEFHYSRFPDADWRKELLKMKAGGINIVASYIFWIHHEEREGTYNWSGQRNLRKFIETCQEVGMPFILRIGPWCHGEARNGGLPEWLVTSGIKLRSNDQAYLAKVQTWFEQLYKQVEGLMWKDGGPIIGVQIENEYSGNGEHLMTLKEMIRKTGYDVPLYTRTGWPKLSKPVPFGEIIPLYGDYADGFWDRSLQEMPGDYSKSYLFRSFRNSTVIATEQLPQQSDKDNPDDVGYPYFTCELGGGMMPGYHRRINIAPMDVYSMALVRVGSGSNLPGYYMYHGGTNPDSEVTTLNERQNSHFTNYNDLPVKSYDFQAPLAEFGQVNPHYHLLRKLHLFLHDFGSELSGMQPYFPEVPAQDVNDDSLLRWSVRSNGQSGFVFVNNYQRLKTLSAKENVRFTLHLPEEELTFPKASLTIPSGASFFMPFNLKLGDVKMVYSTAQPIARLVNGNEQIYVFASNRGIHPEFAFESEGIKVESSNAKSHIRNGRIYFEEVKTGMDAAISLRSKSNQLITILLLDEKTSSALWKGKLLDKERLFITHSNLTWQNNQLNLTTAAGNETRVCIYPMPQKLSYKDEPLKQKKQGLFTEYRIKSPDLSPVNVKLVQIKKEDTQLRTIRMGKAKVAEQPDDSDFTKAAVWKIVLPDHINPSRDIFLKIPYLGDVARVYLNDTLLTDNFFNGKPLVLGLKRFAPAIYQKELTIKILPLAKDAPVYLPNKKSLSRYSEAAYLLDIPKIEVEEEYNVSLH